MVKTQSTPSVDQVDDKSAIGRTMFGFAVRSQRKRLRLSQAELARQAGLHRTYVCDVERGARNISLDSIRRLALALKIPTAALFEDVYQVAPNQN